MGSLAPADPRPDDGRDRLLIKGGARLRGALPVAGSPRGAEFLLPAALLVDADRSARCLLRNVPDVGDVRRLRAHLGALGLSVEGRGGVVAINGGTPTALAAGELGSAAALPLLGALLGRWGAGQLTLPPSTPAASAGDNPTLRGLAALGAEVRVVAGAGAGSVVVEGRRLRGGSFRFPTVSATATATLVLAAVRGRGRIALENCSLAPEVEELGRVLNKMGARVHGAGTALVTIEGVETLEPVEHTLLPDRIEAGTLLLAGAITRGDLFVRDCTPEHLGAVADQLRAALADVGVEAGGLRVRGSAEAAPVDIAMRPYPGVPSALAPSFLVFMARARGDSIITGAPPGDFGELAQLGVALVAEGDRVVVSGPRRLKGGRVTARDPQMAAALVLAGLAVEGTAEILQISHLDRRYERLDKKLKAVGADLRRARATPAG